MGFSLKKAFNAVNPVRVARKAIDETEGLVNSTGKLAERTGESLSTFADDQVGFDANRNRGLFDPLGSRQRKDEAARDAEEARTLEEQRQRNVASAMDRVNSEFGRFDDNHYGGITQAYIDFYRPQIDEQFQAAKRDITLASPSSGSSAFARNLGLLGRDYSRELVSLNDRALSAAMAARQRTEAERQQLLDIARGGAGVDDVGSQAVLRAKLATTPQPYSALGDLFARYAATAGNAVRARSAGYNVESPLLFGGRSGSNVSTVG